MNQGVKEIKQFEDKVFILGYHVDGTEVYEHIVEFVINMVGVVEV